MVGQNLVLPWYDLGMILVFMCLHCISKYVNFHNLTFMLITKNLFDKELELWGSVKNFSSPSKTSNHTNLITGKFIVFIVICGMFIFFATMFTT